MHVVNNNRELRGMKDMLMARVTDVMQKANKLKAGHHKHAYLWTESRYLSYVLPVLVLNDFSLSSF